ncbi:DUF1428 domain-containing protein [Terrarubrum flagellatum]|uniref:DUF1428 domain-containing protein n=1 Tax=Terrirubrum flagellatum TaxID=2895980 RepID=UPI00314527FC
MPFTDGMVAAVPTTKKEEYLSHARKMAAVFKEHGALKISENWGEDVPDGKLTDFKRAVQATPDETVVLGWITWADKAARDAGWEKIMQDPRMKDTKMPFDGKRMIYAGFANLMEM